MWKEIKMNNNKANKKLNAHEHILHNSWDVKMLKLWNILKTNVSGNSWLTKDKIFYVKRGNNAYNKYKKLEKEMGTILMRIKVN